MDVVDHVGKRFGSGQQRVDEHRARAVTAVQDALVLELADSSASPEPSRTESTQG